VHKGVHQRLPVALESWHAKEEVEFDKWKHETTDKMLFGLWKDIAGIMVEEPLV
jgi:hypothetical protein